MLFCRPPADGNFGFFLANFQIGTDAVVLFLTDERSHLGFAVERWAQLDALGLFRHGLDKFGINLFFDENATAGRANFSLINEYAKERAIDRCFPIRFGEENIRRLAAEFEGDT